jgi:hypothetical protein
VVVLDSQWATTVEFVVTAHERRHGAVHIREAAPGNVPAAVRLSGRPGPGHLIAAKADQHSTWVTAIEDDHLPIFYATTNVWEFLGQGLRTSGGSRSGFARRPRTRDNLRLGRALGDAIAESDRKVVLIASGAALAHVLAAAQAARSRAAGVEHIFTADAAAADFERLTWFREGDHARVLETMPDFYRFKPEARFGHYLMMIGALGEGDCRATSRQYGEYENSIGTGQVHLWFDRPEGGFPPAQEDTRGRRLHPPERRTRTHRGRLTATPPEE